ncbi:hypothetical protein WJX81_005180 [Elliptochloris bilobata]|uniref:Uncharacterized protein n=1 Tax=Elliptochloris bilobata TaxID=381761 RepID=A0AAW1RQV1_9CHLO
MTVRSLLQISLESLASNISRVTTLHGLPEELLVELFEAVLSKGKLQPRVLSLFEETGQDLLLARISTLNLQPLPVVLPLTRNAWLGEKPNCVAQPWQARAACCEADGAFSGE